MSERIDVIINTTEAKSKLDDVKKDTQETKELVDTVNTNARAVNALTREQTIMVATRTWSVVRNSMRLMGITMDAGFAGLIDVGLQTVQFFSTMATIHAANPVTFAQSVMYGLQAGSAGLALAVSIASKIAAAERLNQQRRLANSIGNSYY